MIQSVLCSTDETEKVMKKFELAVEPRTIGKHFSRALRRDRKVPAVIYGTSQNSNVFVDENTVLKFTTRAYENALFSLKSNDSKVNGVVVLMKEVVVHPVTRRPQHLDLFALDLKKPVRLFVEIRFDGKPIGLAEGGLLNIVNRQIEIECLPTEIPEGFSMDISEMGVGDTKHVSDLKLPPSTKLISSKDLTLAVVSEYVEEELTPTPVAAAEGAAVPGAEGAAAGAAPAAGATAAPGAAPAAGAKAAPGAAPAGKDAKAPAKK
jgi:large subunit ribosomal protein L25